MGHIQIQINQYQFLVRGLRYQCHCVLISCAIISIDKRAWHSLQSCSQFFFFCIGTQLFLLSLLVFSVLITFFWVRVILHCIQIVLNFDFLHFLNIILDTFRCGSSVGLDLGILGFIIDFFSVCVDNLGYPEKNRKKTSGTHTKSEHRLKGRG